MPPHKIAQRSRGDKRAVAAHHDHVPHKAREVISRAKSGVPGTFLLGLKSVPDAFSGGASHVVRPIADNDRDALDPRSGEGIERIGDHRSAKQWSDDFGRRVAGFARRPAAPTGGEYQSLESRLRLGHHLGSTSGPLVPFFLITRMSTSLDTTETDI